MDYKITGQYSVHQPCLAVLPFVKYRNLFSCLKVSTLLSLFALPVSIATATTSVFVFMAVGWIPLVGAFQKF